MWLATSALVVGLSGLAYVVVSVVLDVRDGVIPGWIKPTAERMALIELLAMAQKKGLDFTTMEFLEFTGSLRQAGVDGKIKFFGKPKHGVGFEMLVDGDPLRAIDGEEWLRYKIDQVGVLDGNGRLSTDNRGLATYDMADIYSTDGYVDLHVDRKQAMRWLAKRR